LALPEERVAIRIEVHEAGAVKIAKPELMVVVVAAMAPVEDATMFLSKDANYDFVYSTELVSLSVVVVLLQERLDE
jgi:hypothetical protein